MMDSRRLRNYSTPVYENNSVDAFDKNCRGHCHKYDGQDDRGESFVASVAELVSHVGPLACDTDHDDDNDVAEEIGKRMYAVGDESRASPEYASCDFCYSEHGVEPKSDPCDVSGLMHGIDGTVVGNDVSAVLFHTQIVCRCVSVFPAIYVSGATASIWDDILYIRCIGRDLPCCTYRRRGRKAVDNNNHRR